MRKSYIKIIAVIFYILLPVICFGQGAQVTDTLKLDYRTKESLDTNLFNVFPKKVNKTKVGLVLSGGGARGISQLGVMSVLDENNIEIDQITGTSIGGVTGGLYATGYTPSKIRDIFKNVDWVTTLSLTDKYQRQYLFLDQKLIQDKSLLSISIDGFTPTFPSSLSSGQKLTELINILMLNAKYHPRQNFKDLKIPLTVVATDFDKGEKVVLTEGNLSESIKASFTFPLLYSSINIDGKNLVDGGLTANIPVSVAKESGSDYIITVNSTSPLRKREEITNPLYTADHILSITMNQLNNAQLQNSNIVITPDIERTSTFDFEKIDYLYEKGRLAAQEQVQKIIEGIDSAEIASSKYFNNFLINATPKLTILGENQARFNFTKITENFTDNKFIRYTEIEQKLKQLYKTGYFNKVEAQIVGETNGATINFIAESNDVLENIVSNSSYPEITDLINSFRTLNKNNVLNLNQCFKFYETLLQTLRDNNLSLVEIEKFYFNHANKTLEIYFSDGKISNLDIEGNDKSNENLILRELSFDKEEIIRKDNLENSLKNIIGTNLFRQVSFDFDFEKKRYQPDLLIRVVERSSRNIRISGRVDNERNLQGYFDIRDENLFGTGLEAGAFFAGGLRNQYFEFEFKSNQLFKSPLTYDLSYYTGFRNIYEYKTIVDNENNEYDRTQTGEYKNKKTGYSILVGLQVEKLGTIYGKLGFEYLAAQNLTPVNLLREEYNTLKFKFGGNFDTRNILPYPTNGSLINFFYETSQNRLGADISYSKLFLNYEQYVSLGRLHTIRPRFIFGSADKTTPLPEYFTIGGEDSFYGMVEDEATGRQILEFSLEYRFKSPFKFFFDTYFKARYDIGRIWDNTTDVKFKDLRHGIGSSICFDTPIGESSFSVGKTFLIQKGLTQDSFIFGPYTYYFSIGYKF
ncbi:MAG: patatin-like phospholipase family protein [Ignavibacteria bacterium]|nr:patatin-like phospholipase family protein [Ignavibacteria bacterium]